MTARPKYKIDKYLKFKNRSMLETGYVYVLKEHRFWIFYREVHRSPNEDTVMLLKKHMENKQ